jgi:hypothetical protein
MGEKSSIFQGIQVGIESTPGTPVAAGLKLLATSIVPRAKVEADTFRAAGNKYASFAVLNKEWSEAAIEGKLTYNEVLYLLSSMIKQPTPVQQGVTDAYKWTFESSTSAEDAGKTLTIEQGDANSAWRGAGLRVSGLELTFTRSEVTIGGSAIGEPLETGITMTATPTSLASRPVLPAHVKLYMADTQAGLGSASPISRGFGMTWNLTDKVGLAWPIGQDPITLETVPNSEAKLKLASDTVGLGLVATMRAGSTKWLRVKCEGETIDAPYKYTFQIDFPAQVKDVSEFSDDGGIYMLEYSLAMIHDATWGKAFSIDVITDVSTL